MRYIPSILVSVTIALIPFPTWALQGKKKVAPRPQKQVPKLLALRPVTVEGTEYGRNDVPLFNFTITTYLKAENAAEGADMMRRRIIQVVQEAGLGFIPAKKGELDAWTLMEGGYFVPSDDGSFADKVSKITFFSSRQGGKLTGSVKNLAFGVRHMEPEWKNGIVSMASQFWVKPLGDYKLNNTPLLVLGQESYDPTELYRGLYFAIKDALNKEGDLVANPDVHRWAQLLRISPERLARVKKPRYYFDENPTLPPFNKAAGPSKLETRKEAAYLSTSDFSGAWTGTLRQPGTSFTFKLDLRQTDTSLSGTSSITDPAGKSAMMTMTGDTNSQGITLKESGIKFQSNDGIWCLKSMKLSYQPEGEVLSGNWEGEMATGSYCNRGTVSLRRAVPTSPQTVHGSTSSLFQMAFSPSASMVATYDPVKGVRVSTFPENKTLTEGLNAEGIFMGLAFSPDEKILATSGEDTIRLWDVASGKMLRGLQMERSGFFKRPTFTKDGKQIFAIGSGSLVRVWDTTAGTLIRRFPETQETRVFFGKPREGWDKATCIGLSNDDRWLFTGMGDGEIRVWDLRTGKKEKILKSHEVAIGLLAQDPSNRHLVSVSINGQAVVWDIQSFKKIRAFECSSTGLAGARLTPAGNQLLAVDADGKVRIVDISTGSIIQEVPTAKSPVVGLAFRSANEAVFYHRDGTKSEMKF